MRTKNLLLLLLYFLCGSIPNLFSQEENINKNKFRQLGQELPTPNVYRTASGAPGHEYWQQQADYVMDIEIDDEKQSISGFETITYHNNSPDPLDYVWLQLDQNVRATDSDSYIIKNNSISEKMSPRQLKGLTPEFDGGFKIQEVKDISGKPLSYVINKTMMRIDLPKTLTSGSKTSFSIKWWYNINNRAKDRGRSGYEYFDENDNYLYVIAQFFPRMCVYNEVEGWQNKQFLGSGEFALAFGDYEVNITVPADHMVAATGILQNPKDVLTDKQISRLDKARKEREQPVFIVTEEEARKAEKKKSNKKATWAFKAKNVRDFGFASSRKFIWDAMGVPMSNGEISMAMSMYPKEGNPLWEKYSTKAVAHTLKWYSHYTFDYPYPVAWSIHTDRIGMEYPMICFNGGRPEADGTYTARTKYGLISVIIHEVGHNYFPMIVNSDERQWTWMDEGLNSFTQTLAEAQWERDYPSRRGSASIIVDYMKTDKTQLTPIMTNSESIFQFGNNAYGKPAAGLHILRETVMGRELFDFAYKTYARRWAFKHPSPADFFRTMEDASSVDLDWFWRGWFYTTDHVDIAIEDVNWYKVDSKNPDIEMAARKQEKENEPRTINSIRNEKEIAQTRAEKDASLYDFYNMYDEFKTNDSDRKKYNKYLSSLSDEEKTLLQSGSHYYEMTFKNIGGLVMPLIVEMEFMDGTKEVKRIPAEIWLKNHHVVSKVFITQKEVKQITLDPFLETADTDTANNYFPPQQQINRFELFKRQQRDRPNLMQKEQKRVKESGGTN